MPLRVTFHESSDADELVDLLTTAGFAAGVVRERFAGDDDGEEVVYVVHTDAPDTDVAEPWQNAMHGSRSPPAGGRLGGCGPAA